MNLVDYARVEEEKSKKELGLPKHVEHPSQIEWESYRGERGGIIPFTFSNGRMVFVLGVDRRYDNYTDFGGRVEGRDLSLLDTAFREFYEESRIYPCFDLARSAAVMSSRTCVLFTFIAPNILKKLLRRRSREISEVVELTWEQMIELFKGSRVGGRALWERLQNLFYPVEIVQKLSHMLSIYSRSCSSIQSTEGKLGFASQNWGKCCRVVLSPDVGQQLDPLHIPDLRVKVMVRELTETWYGPLIDPSKTTRINLAYHAVVEGGSILESVHELQQYVAGDGCKIERLLESNAIVAENSHCIFVVVDQEIISSELVERSYESTVRQLARNFNTEYRLRRILQLLT